MISRDGVPLNKVILAVFGRTIVIAKIFYANRV
jgi:hypothetical protein